MLIKTIYLVLVCVFISITDVQSYADDVKKSPYNYHEGFEGGHADVMLWASNGTSTINYLGRTDEQVFSGKYSFKLDITLQDGTYHYYGVKSNPIPLDGDLELSARIRVGESSTATVLFGSNMLFLPSKFTGIAPIDQGGVAKDHWNLLTDDLVTHGSKVKNRVLRRKTDNLNGDEVGAYFDRWSLFIYGSPGDRAVIYLDDITIEGRVPLKPHYDADMNKRYSSSKNKFLKELSLWEKKAQTNAVYSGLLEKDTILSESITKSQKIVSRLIGKARQNGYMEPGDAEKIQIHIATIENLSGYVNSLPAYSDKIPSFLVATENQPIKKIRVFPPIHSDSNKDYGSLECRGTRGETRSVSVSILALEDLKQLDLRISNLTSNEDVIFSSAINVRYVKWWYQGRGGARYSPIKEYKPELLLKDNQLIKVDKLNKQNYIRNTESDKKNTYLLCSAKTSNNLSNLRPMDADELVPTDLARGEVQEYWVNISIPNNAKSGEYTGVLEFFADNASVKTVPIKVSVYPFELIKSPLIYSIYYRGVLSSNVQHTVSDTYKTEQQFHAEMVNIKKHGVLYPTSYQPFKKGLIKSLQLRSNVGIPKHYFFNLGQHIGNPVKTEDLAKLRADVVKWIKLLNEYGYSNIYFYGIDEAKGARLLSQKQAWQEVQKSGGKIFVATNDRVDKMGSLLSMPVLHGPLNSTYANEWHSVGSKVLSYSNPQVGDENPVFYRSNYGLALLMSGYDGAMNYAYQHHGKTGHIWNDFDHPRYRDLVFAYPTINGVVDTIAWEGFREAIYDVRYAATLKKAIDKASETNLSRKAQIWFDGINPEKDDLDKIRNEMSRMIMRLNQ